MATIRSGQRNGRWVVTISCGRDPETNRQRYHTKPLRGTSCEAHAYAEWYEGLVKAGLAPRQTVSQSQLREMQALLDKAAWQLRDFKEAVRNGALVEPGPLTLA